MALKLGGSPSIFHLLLIFSQFKIFKENLSEHLDQNIKGLVRLTPFNMSQQLDKTSLIQSSGVCICDSGVYRHIGKH